MNNAMKKELALMTGLLALASARARAPKLATALSLGAAGLYLFSFKKNFNFKEKRVFITGGSRGLGLSLAWNLLKQGAQVTLVASDEKELREGKEHLLKDFPEGLVEICVCDVTNHEQLAKTIDTAIEKMGRIDVLINNAGSILVGPLATMERKDFDAQIRLHLYAAIEAVRLITPHFKARGGGRILNISSLGGKVAVPHMLPYDASKFALAGFSQGAAAELAADNILVTTAYPTVMRTGSPIQAVFKGDHEKEYAWFAAGDNLPGLSMSADKAAKKILNAVADGQTEIVLSLPAKARMFFGAIFPESMHAIMKMAAAAMPAGESRKRKTGAQAEQEIGSSPVIKPLKEKVKRTEETYNQKPRNSAEFNLGLKRT